MNSVLGSARRACCVSSRANFGEFTLHTNFGVYARHTDFGVYTLHSEFGEYTLHSNFGEYAVNTDFGEYTLHSNLGEYTLRTDFGVCTIPPVLPSLPAVLFLSLSPLPPQGKIQEQERSVLFGNTESKVHDDPKPDEKTTFLTERRAKKYIFHS